MVKFWHLKSRTGGAMGVSFQKPHMLTSFLRPRSAPLSPRKRVPGFMEPLVRPRMIGFGLS